jgi:hypothetical protein
MTTDTEIAELKEQLLLFKEKLAMDKTHLQFGATILRQSTANPLSNRGSKLDPTSDEVDRMKLGSMRNSYRLTPLKIYNNDTEEYESKLVYVNKEADADLEEKIRQQVEDEFGSEDEHETDISAEPYSQYTSSIDDLHGILKFDEILKPITKPTDVVNIRSIANIYKDRYLERLSNETIATIEKEQDMVNLLNRIMDVFLHDDPDHMSAENLGLPEYDHNLDLEKVEKNGPAQPNMELPGDPFFLPPNYESDPKFEGIDSEEVDETKQLLQIALQRNEEFIRSLSQIRSGFLHADTYKRHVYNWCKEMDSNEQAQRVPLERD